MLPICRQEFVNGDDRVAGFVIGAGLESRSRGREVVSKLLAPVLQTRRPPRTRLIFCVAAHGLTNIKGHGILT